MLNEDWKQKFIDNNQQIIFPALILFLVNLALRLPFQVQIPQGDEINFALAIDHIDVRLEQPQMPGMFLIFIFLGRFFHLFVDDPTSSLVLVNIMASGIAVSMFYILGTQWYGSRVGWSISLLCLTSPFVWYYSESAFSHVLEFTWVTLILYTGYHTALGRISGLMTLAILMGLAGGIRPSTPFFVLPFALVATFLGLRTKGFNLRQVILAVGLGILAIAVWFIPLLVTSGGFESYWELVQSWLPLHTERKDAKTLVAIVDNLMLILKAYLRIVGIAIIPMFWILVKDFKSIHRHLKKEWSVQAIFLSIIPGFIYFLFVHLRRKAQTLTIMPAIMVMAGLCIVWFGDRFKKYHRRSWAIILAVIVSLNGLFFLIGPNSLPTASSILDWNAEMEERIAVIRETFPPESTAIHTRLYYSRLTELYFKDYQEPTLSRRLTDIPIILPKNINTLVLLDKKSFNDLEPDSHWKTLPLKGNQTLRYITWTSEEEAQITNNSIKIKQYTD